MKKNILTTILLMLIISFFSSCATTSNDSKKRDSYTNYKSKVEVLEEKHLGKGKFLGNTNVGIIYKNYDALVREKSYEGKETDRKKKDKLSYNYESEAVIPAGGHIEFEIEAASLNGAKLGQFDLTLVYGKNKVKYSNDKITFKSGSKFSHIDEEYKIEVFKNNFILQLTKRNTKPFELIVMDNYINKISRFKISPYVSQ